MKELQGTDSSLESLWSLSLFSYSRNSLPLWNSVFHHHIHKSTWLESILSQLNPVHTFIHYFSTIILKSSFHPQDFLIKILYAFLTVPYRLHAPPISSYLF